MPDFAHVKAPVFSPTCCATCATSSHPQGFVDLLAEYPRIGADGAHYVYEGHLYLCAGCAFTAGQKLGMLSPAQADNLRGELKHAESVAAGLRADLETERANKMVSLDDVKELVRQRGGRPPVAA